jgi:hypothetical protein
MSSIRIPDLKAFYNDIVSFVKEHQGENGYIDTNTEENGYDSIYALCSDGWTSFNEKEIEKVRVNERGVLQIELCDSTGWYDVEISDYILFVPTLFEIGECIEDFV